MSSPQNRNGDKLIVHQGEPPRDDVGRTAGLYHQTSGLGRADGLLFGQVWIEIKFDDRLDETGNLYIETAEKSHPLRPHYVPSGIYRMDNGWLYAIGNYRVVYLFVTRHLRWLHERDRLTEIETATSQGFLLPELMARKYAARILPASDQRSL